MAIKSHGKQSFVCSIYDTGHRALAALVLLIGLQSMQLNAATNNADDLAADIRILIDVSGSMKQNDPQNLRRPALDLLLQLIPQDSKAGVWTFGRYVNMLVSHNNVSDSWRVKAEPQSRLINSVALHTNIGLALEKANYDSDKRKFPAAQNYNKSVILLTDGVVDIDADSTINEKERDRILSQVLPAYKEAGITIHTVALSTNADVELLEKLSLETDGAFAVAEDASDLNRIFLNAFDRAAPADRVPLEDNRFLIDSSIEEFTALVFRKPGSDATQIESPAGDRYNAASNGASVRWFASDEYDLITIKQPVEGEWKINAELDPENRVTVISNLTLDIAPLPNNLFIGSEPLLIATLKEADAPITDDAFLDVITVTASMMQDYQSLWQQGLARNFSSPGVYQRSLGKLDENGNFLLSVNVDGKTFKREKKVKFSVQKPFSVQLQTNEANGQYGVKVIAKNADYFASDVGISLLATLPDKSEQELILNRDSENTWSINVNDQVTGDYKIVVKVKAPSSSQPTQEALIDTLRFYLNVPGIAAPVQVEPVIKEPIVEQPVAVVEEPILQEPVVEEEPVIASEEPEVVEEKSGPNMWLIGGGLVAGNLLLMGLLYFLYRKLTSSPIEEIEEVNEASDAAPVDEEAQEKVEEVVAEEDPAIEEPAEEVSNDADFEVDLDATLDKTTEDSVDESSKNQESSAEPTISEDPEPTAEELEKMLADISDDTESIEVEATKDVEPDISIDDLDAALDEAFSEEGIEVEGSNKVETAPEDEAAVNLEDLDAALDAAFSEEGIEVEGSDSAETTTADEASIDLEDLDAALDAAFNEEGITTEDDSDISVSLDGEFDLSTDITDDVKKQSGT